MLESEGKGGSLAFTVNVSVNPIFILWKPIKKVYHLEDLMFYFLNFRLLLEKFWYSLFLGLPASAVSSHFLLLNITQIRKSRLQSFKDLTSKQRN